MDGGQQLFVANWANVNTKVLASLLAISELACKPLAKCNLQHNNIRSTIFSAHGFSKEILNAFYDVLL